MKKLKFNKFIICSILCVLLVSLFSVSCFADTENGVFDKGDSFVFNDLIALNILPSSPTLTGEFYVTEP